MGSFNTAGIAAETEPFQAPALVPDSQFLLFPKRSIDGLLDQPRLTADQQDYLDVLADLVHAYESAKHPLEPQPDAAMLWHLLEAKGVSQGQAARESGLGSTTLSLVLSGRRRLTRAQVDRVARYFGVSPAVFAVPEAEAVG
jgi:HTH-type transcriptional regulator / antitoxin HigA